MIEMYIHDFHAICEKGHKRNFVYWDDSDKEFSLKKEFCVWCNKRVNFKVVKYFKPIEKVKNEN
jgi:hypothetical protein